MTHKHVFLSNASGYCAHACVHGPAYLLTTRNRTELAFWTLVVATVVVLATYLVSLAVQFWLEAPLAWEISDKAVQPSDIPFPTVTICLEQKLDEYHLASHLLDQVTMKVPVGREGSLWNVLSSGQAFLHP